jgi:hypothetical protein
MSRRRDQLTAQAALAFDELLLRDDIGELLSALAETLPTGHADQARAAATDTTRGMETIAALLGGTYTDTPPADVPAWVRLGLLTTLTRWAAGQGSTCMHAPTPDRPQPVTAAAWRPDIVACARCTRLFHLRPGSDADRRCDGCGTVTTSVEDDNGIYPAAVQLGQLSYLYGVCRGCKHWPDS